MTTELEDLRDLVDFTKVVTIDDDGEWLKEWVKFSIVKEKIRKAADVQQTDGY